MHNFQNFIISVRESKNLEISTVADATNLSQDIIKKIESANNDMLLFDSSSILKTQVRRYCEYLEISEKKITSILNKIDILYYKKSKIGKLKLFDYLNRTIIFVLSIVLILGIVKVINENIYELNNKESLSQEETIIYTPISYNQTSYDDRGENNSEKSQEESTEKKTYDAGLNSSVAHPPAQANMESFVIDDSIPVTSSSDDTNASQQDNQTINEQEESSSSQTEAQDLESQQLADNANDYSPTVSTDIEKNNTVKSDNNNTAMDISPVEEDKDDESSIFDELF